MPLATPNETRFMQTLRTLFHGQAREVKARLTPQGIKAGKEVDLSHWPAAMVPHLRPYLIKAWQQGMAESVRQLGSNLNRDALNIDKLRKRMLREVDQTILDFCTEAVQRIQDEVNAAAKEIKRKYKRNELSWGEVKREIDDLVMSKVASPNRAKITADYQSHAGKQAGKLLIAEASGNVGGKRWICKFTPTTCDVCKSLHGRTVAIDEAFIVLPGGGPYATVWAPPTHPHCFCESQLVLGVVGKRKKSWEEEMLEERRLVEWA